MGKGNHQIEEFMEGKLSEEAEKTIKEHLINSDTNSPESEMYKSFNSYRSQPVDLRSRGTEKFKILKYAAVIGAILIIIFVYWNIKSGETQINAREWAQLENIEKLKLLSFVDQKKLSGSEIEFLISVLQDENNANVKILIINTLKSTDSRLKPSRIKELSTDDDYPVVQASFRELISKLEKSN